MTPPSVLRHPAFRPAFQLTLALWACSFVLLEIMVWTTGRGDPVGTLSSILQFGTACALAALLIAVVIAAEDVGRGARFAFVALVFTAVLVAQGLIDLATSWALGRWLAGRRGWATLDSAQFLRATFTYLWVFGLDLVLIYLTLARTRMEAQWRELAEVRAQAVQAQLAMLRYQLNPHFLFNTLNAISTLVVTRRNDDAEEMLTKLSGFLRASLANAPDDYVRLDAELEILQEYLEIEGVRFGERLIVEFACDPAAAPMLVPSFLLQPLIENAIKYAVGLTRRPVTIRIEAHLEEADVVIAVEDDGEGGAHDGHGGTGVGLRNVRARLQTLYGPRGLLQAGRRPMGFRAVVRLPARSTRETT